MTTDSNSGDSNLDDEVTLAATDRAVQDIKAEAERARGDFSVWTEEDAASPAEPAEPTGAPSPSVDPGIADEPTIIRGFGDEPTTPLDNRAASQVAALRKGKTGPEQKAEPVAPAKPAIGPNGRDSRSSLIGDLQPPQSDTSFFGIDDLAPDPTADPAASTARTGKFPIGLIVLGVLLVAATITIVLAVLLGSSAL